MSPCREEPVWIRSPRSGRFVRPIGIAPHVQGPLVRLNVVDNQPVEENDLLFVIDPRPYEAELQRAQGELIVAQAEVSGIEQAIAGARAEVVRLRADMAYARTHAGRLEPLVGGRFISADQYQEAVTKARSLDAARDRTRVLTGPKWTLPGQP